MSKFCSLEMWAERSVSVLHKRYPVSSSQSARDSVPHPHRPRGYILNQAAVEALGWSDEEAVGMPFRLSKNSDGPVGEVIGVVENFHLGSLRSPIAPVVLALQLESSSENMLAARLVPNDISAGVNHLRNVMNDIAPQVKFSYTFADAQDDALEDGVWRPSCRFVQFLSRTEAAPIASDRREILR